jgi:hypothetical protein
VPPDKQKKPFDFKAWDPSQTRQPETVSLHNAHTPKQNSTMCAAHSHNSLDPPGFVRPSVWERTSIAI